MINLINRKSQFDYETIEEFEAGMVLKGPEVKAIKKNAVDFSGSHVVITNDEAFVINLHIGVDGDTDTRTKRKLLLNKKEILNLKLRKESEGLTIVPISMYNVGTRIKLKIALVRGRKKHDKRSYKQAQDVKRDIDREIKEYNN
jgi:SsrA-binding protein